MKKCEWTLQLKIVAGSVGFIVLYILTIPVRDYQSLGVENVTLLTHLVIIILGITAYTVLMTVIHLISTMVKRARK